ncbi:hypothetical protein [Luteolibacter soli]|uniref:Uncharacterized protein n=1 Tax=Luteolibacter soli TaxID=3135280 RepID=A0ABU9AV29_9BACT
MTPANLQPRPTGPLTRALRHACTPAAIPLSAAASSGAGLITRGNTPTLSPGGRAIFISLTDSGYAFQAAIYNSVNSMLGAPSATFDSLLADAIGTTSGTSPGIVRTAPYAHGAFTSAGSTQMGAAGNLTYLFLVEDGEGSVKSLGLYRGPKVPATGSLHLDPSNVSNVGIGTTHGGYQLISIPDPTTVLLGVWSLSLPAFSPC